MLCKPSSSNYSYVFSYLILHVFLYSGYESLLRSHGVEGCSNGVLLKTLKRQELFHRLNIIELGVWRNAILKKIKSGQRKSETSNCGTTVARVALFEDVGLKRLVILPRRLTDARLLLEG